jgi:hypothetical protein
MADVIAPFAVARKPSNNGRRAARPRRSRTYTRAQLLDAMRRWTERYGKPPTGIDWEPARARRTGQSWRAERYEADEWPTARMVRCEFGRFNDGLRAAGLAARRAPDRVVPNLTGPEAILVAIREWVRRYGEVPAMADWDPVRARHLGQEWRIVRYRSGDWPSARSVNRHFRSFRAAVASAGLVPRDRAASAVGREADRRVNRIAAATVAALERADGMTGLAAAVRAVAAARRAGDPVAVHAALVDVAAAALACAEFGPLDCHDADDPHDAWEQEDP